VAVFDENGDLLQNLVGGPLAAPWGLAVAPTGFGAFGGDLLVGNFASGDSEINIFNPSGTLGDTIHIDPGGANMPGGLWDLTVRRRRLAGDPDTLFITDGINGEKDGLFVALTVPEPWTWAMILLGFGGLLFAAWRRGAAVAISEGRWPNGASRNGSVFE
jgi:hypothetical protein